MRKFLFLLVLLCIDKALHAQYVYTIKADSVKITNTCDTAELIIENHTQTVPGFLFNKGRGRTEFRRGLLKITDSIYIVGGDTLKMNPWLQGGNRFGTTGMFGTMDNNHIDFYSNSIQRARLTNKGALQIGSLAWDNEDKLQVGNNGAVTIAANLSRATDRIQIGKAFNFGDGQNALIRTSSDNGATYRDVLVERDGYIGLGTSNRPVGGWFVGNPALRILSNGMVNIGSNYFVFGNTGGEWNASGLHTYVSNTDEWHTGLGNYPNRQHYYYFGTGLSGPEGTNVRANLKISGRELNFLTGIVEAEAMQIAESKNVLIGTTFDDGNRLQVAGHSKLSGDLTVGGKYVQAAPQTSLFGNSLFFDNQGSAARIICDREIVYQSNYSGDQHVFTNQVGSLFDGTLVTLDPGYNPHALADTQVVLKVLTKFRTESAPGLIVNMAGSVGIGTEIPSAQLHATGSVRFGGLTNNNSLTRIVVSDASGNLYTRDYSTFVLNKTLNSDLAVNGRVSAQKMVITQTGRWPDYVFSNHYTLPSLSEVENFIKQNNHLPGIPSAAEVEKKGIDVGNNQAALLQKIEELTLYAIEQEKKIQKQNDQIKDLLNLKQEMAELKALIKK
jgi:hypothetical protein